MAALASRKRQFLRTTSIGMSLGLLMTALVPAVSFADSAMPYDFHAWNGNELASGLFDNTKLIHKDGHQVVELNGSVTSGTWQSPTYDPHVPIAKLVSSWQADTPGNTSIETDLSVRVNGSWSNWYVMGKWAFGTTAAERTSVSGQQDQNGSISQDSYYDGDTPATAYRLRVALHGADGISPAVQQVAAVASNPTTVNETASQTTMKKTIDLHVPGLSQYVHDGEYPQYDGGGEAWCSPTSVAMILEYWHKGPTNSQVAGLPQDPVFDANQRVDGIVDYAAYHSFDYSADQQNTGDWPFNTAYAASFGLDTSVRQYSSLRNVESWIKQGIPIVVSTSWNNTDTNPGNDLTGASIASTAGHIMVVRGFTANGDVIANDPASPNDMTVRHIYNRAQFERDWLNHSDGTVYVIKPFNRY